MPASPSPSLLDDAHPRSYDPLSSQRRLPKLTPARLTFFAATLGLGIPKAVTSAEGQETVTNILNLNLGVVWPCVAYCLGILENECPQTAPWFFEYDLFQISPVVLDLVLPWVAIMIPNGALLYALFHSNPTLPNDPTFNLVLPLIQIGLPLVTLLLYVGLERITREYRPRARTLLILPQKVYRKVQLEVHHFACNIVNRYNRHFVTYYKICSAGLLFSVLLHGPLDYLSLDGRRWISQMATILSLSLGLLLLFFYFAIMNKGGPQPYMISFSPNSGPPSSNSSHECSVPLEVIVVDPARCEIDPVRSGSDNSSTTVGGSTRISTTHGPFLPLSDGQSEQKAEVHNAKAGPSQPGRIPPLPSAMIRLTRVESECGLLSNDTVSTGMTREHSSSMSSQRHSSHSLSAMPNSSPAETHRRDSIYHDPTSPSFSPPSLRDTNSIERVMAPTTDSEQ